MKIVTLNEVKAHLRIDDSFSDTELTLKADAAEQEALDYMERTYDSLIVEYGAIPASIKNAVLNRIGSMWRNREDVSNRSMARVPYTWEAVLIKYKPTWRI